MADAQNFFNGFKMGGSHFITKVAFRENKETTNKKLATALSNCAWFNLITYRVIKDIERSDCVLNVDDYLRNFYF